MSLAGPSPRQGGTTVSFIVIAFNEEGNIENCLRSILAQTGAQIREVIVVDDASTDGTADVVRQIGRESPAVRPVQLPNNRGRGNARAIGVGHAHGDFVAMV